eukprot:TRINITY_DN223_c0_g3_i2.p2 TRINITY_DN223_c0_g3~~TRINITY_DN223_c0_g3_i2.p2  ORF type:complete len:247 (+),score=52.23 TRINITY_DN223_c0_g3_i2:242-982(+)
MWGGAIEKSVSYSPCSSPRRSTNVTEEAVPPRRVRLLMELLNVNLAEHKDDDGIEHAKTKGPKGRSALSAQDEHDATIERFFASYYSLMTDQQLLDTLQLCKTKVTDDQQLCRFILKWIECCAKWMAKPLKLTILELLSELVHKKDRINQTKLRLLRSEKAVKQVHPYRTTITEWLLQTTTADLAAMMTAVEWATFSQIKPWEFTRQAWTKENRATHTRARAHSHTITHNHTHNHTHTHTLSLSPM